MIIARPRPSPIIFPISLVSSPSFPLLERTLRSCQNFLGICQRTRSGSHHTVMIFGGSYLPLLLLGLLLTREASCKSLPKNQICISALINAYSSLTFEGPETYYGSACQSPYKVASLYASCWRYCDQDAVDAGIAYWEDTCHRYGKVDLISQSAVAENLTDKAIAAMPLVEQGEIPLTEVLNKPVMISKFWFDVSYRTVVRSLTHPFRLALP